MNRQHTPKSVTHPDILELLRRPEYAPMRESDIAAHFELRGGSRKALAQLLRQMVLNGDIVMIRKTRYSIGTAADLVTGRIEMKRSGDGYLTNLEGPLDVRVGRADLGTALPGDLVTVRLEPHAPELPEWQRGGKVIEILERAKRVIVGTLRSTGRFLYVVPLDPCYQQDFYVPDAQGAQVNDRVVIQFANWENRHVNPEAEIIEVIGPADNPSLDTLAVIRHHSLRDTFPEEVMREASLSAGRMNAPGQRLDLRDTFIFTVDPATAKDFDDALSLERDGQGQRVLGVHIADVSHFVTLGGALDREAVERGNSVYLPDKVLPMLPEELSNGMCSLKPGQDRMAFSVFMTFDGQGRCVAARFGKSLIRSRLRLTYEQALRVLETPDGMKCREPGVPAEAVPLLREICELALQMRGRRMAQFALDIDMPENNIVIGPNGMIVDIKPVVNDLSHQIIEECMVAANEAVGREIANRGWALLHRLHEPPADDKINDLIVDLREMGYQPGDLRHRRNLMEFLQRIKDTPLAHSAQMAVLRSMKRAVYSATEAGHFGLAKKFYSHFTSPIRRYPDLVVHRILAALLDGQRHPYGGDELKRLALHCSETEQTAQEAERELAEIKKYRFLAQQLEQHKARVYGAVVVKATNFGLFVELDDLSIQGLVHVSALSENFVHYDPALRALRVGKDVYKVGTRMKVFVTRVNFDKRKLDFAVENGRKREGTPRPDRREKSGRRGARPGARRR